MRRNIRCIVLSLVLAVGLIACSDSNQDGGNTPDPQGAGIELMTVSFATDRLQPAGNILLSTGLEEQKPLIDLDLAGQ